MTALPPAFPLAWPDSQNRTRSRDRSQFRTGKSRAGRLLDGREWNDLPGTYR